MEAGGETVLCGSTKDEINVPIALNAFRDGENGMETVKSYILWKG